MPDYIYDGGAEHGEEVAFVFGTPVFLYGTEEEKILSRSMMHAYGTFASTG